MTQDAFSAISTVFNLNSLGTVQKRNASSESKGKQLSQINPKEGYVSPNYNASVLPFLFQKGRIGPQNGNKGEKKQLNGNHTLPSPEIQNA